MSSRRLLPLLFLLCFLPAASSPVHDPLVSELNRHRARAGASLFEWSEELTRVARERSEQLAERGRVTDPDMVELMARLSDRGHPVRRLEEASLLITGGPPSSGIIAQWRRMGADSFDRFLSEGLSDLGVAASQRGDTTVYTFLAATSGRQVLQQTIAGLGSLETVRGDLLDRVNRARRRAGRPSIDRNPLLDRAAQDRADDMVRRSYYAHASPEGHPFTAAVDRAGYAAWTAAENIAYGQQTVDQVMAQWLDSPGHRKNVLDPRVSEAGFGFAPGAPDAKPQLVWVQIFAQPVR